MGKRFRLGLGILVVLILVAMLWKYSGDISWARLRTHWPKVFASLLFFVFVFGINFLAWMYLFRRNLKGVTFGYGYTLFSVTSLSRYLPGGQLWQYAVLAKLPQTKELKTEATTSYLYGTLTGVMSGFLFFVGFFPGNEWKSWGVLIIGFGALLLCFFISNSRAMQLFSNLVSKMTKGRVASVPKLSWEHFLTALGLSGLGWIVVGVGYLSLIEIFPRAEITLGSLLGVYALSVLGGYFSFLTPSGLGVREGLFAALLAQSMPAGEALFVSLVGGVLLVLAEILFLLPSLLLSSSSFRLSQSQSTT